MSISANLGNLLRQLEELQDARTALPITSHRAGYGQLIVSAKRVFRGAFQPFINEVLRKQTGFNEVLVRGLDLLSRDIRSLERAMVSTRHGLDGRVRRLEEELAQLRLQLADRQEEPRATRVAGSDP